MPHRLKFHGRFLAPYCTVWHSVRSGESAPLAGGRDRFSAFHARSLRILWKVFKAFQMSRMSKFAVETYEEEVFRQFFIYHRAGCKVNGIKTSERMFVTSISIKQLQIYCSPRSLKTRSYFQILFDQLLVVLFPRLQFHSIQLQG